MAIMLPPTSIHDLIPFRSAEQDARQGHDEDLARKAVDLAQRLNQAPSPSGQAVMARLIGILQLPVDPADQIAIGHVANEQIQRIGGLVQAAIPQIMLWQRTA